MPHCARLNRVAERAIVMIKSTQKAVLLHTSNLFRGTAPGSQLQQKPSTRKPVTGLATPSTGRQRTGTMIIDRCISCGMDMLNQFNSGHT